MYRIESILINVKREADADETRSGFVSTLEDLEWMQDQAWP